MKELFKPSNIAQALMSLLALVMMFRVDADSFLYIIIGLFAAFAGGIFSVKGMVAKAISVIMLLALVFFAGLITEHQLSDLIILSTWLPFWAGMNGDIIKKLIGNLIGKNDTVEEKKGTD